MSVETDYQPRYVELEDVPVSGPDTYSSEDKRKALFSAESQLELDINNGEKIAQKEVIRAHRLAVMNLATHYLTHSAEDPADVTLGDMVDGGGGIGDYSSKYEQRYEKIVDKINEAGIGSSQYGNFSKTVNSGIDDV